MHDNLYFNLRDEISQLPVIETHTHYTSNTEKFHDAFPIILGYLKSDLRIAAGSDEPLIVRKLIDPDISFDVRYALFRRYYDRCRFSAYAKAMIRGLETCWDIHDVSYDSLCLLNERLTERNNAMLKRILNMTGVSAQIADIFESRFFHIVQGDDTDYTSFSRFAFPLPAFHRLYDGNALVQLESIIGSRPSSLDGYVWAVDTLLERAASWGAVCIKDQSAYFRSLDYSHPTMAQAEQAYGKLVSEPLAHLGEGEGKVLDDWLFQHFLKKAGELNLPVQIHSVCFRSREHR